jgi:glycosyltransferase involved in cell wall biosynthesis
VVIAIAAKPHVYALRTSRPIIYVSDATFTGLSSLYEWYASWPKWLQADANKVERAALAKSYYVVYPSEWAKASAVQDYGVPANRIKVAPFGPNFDPNAIERFKTVKSADFIPNVRLLFVAADWKRKGGVVVLDVKRTLESRGIPCELFLVGDCDPAVEVDATTHVMGRLDKNDPGQLRTLCELYAQAHFFLLPTSGEAFGIVFSEAQAFGCPSLTYAVGGTTTAVNNGETGFTLPLTSPASAFADVIESLVNDPARYETLSANCRRRYENEANWKHWAQGILDLAASSSPWTTNSMSLR